MPIANIFIYCFSGPSQMLMPSKKVIPECSVFEISKIPGYLSLAENKMEFRTIH